MPHEHKKHTEVLEAISKVAGIADLTIQHDGHYDYELDLEVTVYGRNYNGKKVGPYVRLLTYEPGEDIVREGDWGGNTFYIVVDGKADVYAKKGTVKVNEIPAGVQFGEMSVLAGVPRAATVSAPKEQSVQVLELQRPALRLLRKLPQFGPALDQTYRRHGRAATLTGLGSAARLDPETVKQLATVSQFRVYSKKHILFRAGDPIRRVFVLRSGWARLTRAGETGERAAGPYADNVSGETDKRATDSDAADVSWDDTADACFVGPSHCFGVEGITRNLDWEQTCVLTGRSEVMEISVQMLRESPDLREALLKAVEPMAPPPEMIEERRPLPIARAQSNLIETGLVDGTNLLVMDMDMCVRCGNCSMACHQMHGQSRLLRRGVHIERPVKPTLKASSQSVLAPAVCMHCRDAECLTGCPTGAIHRLPGGQIDINYKTCIGCADCATQCPYNAITMIPRKAKADEHPLSRWQSLLRLEPDPAPPAVEVTETDLVATKCNLCANTALNPPDAKRPAFSCEENCPTGALLRVDPRSYFAEIKNIEGVVFKDATHAIARHTSHKDTGKRLMHLLGIVLTLMLTVLTVLGMGRYGLEQPLIGSWLDLRWLTGIVGLIGIAGVMAYPVRRRIYKRRVGPLRYWMLSHTYLGLIAGIVLLLHGGTHSGGILTTALMISFDLVILTGLLGILIYFCAPRVLTTIEGQPLLHEDLTARREELSEEIGEAAAALSDDARAAVEKRVVPRFLSLGYLLRQYLKRESLDEMLKAATTELQSDIAGVPEAERPTFVKAVEAAATQRRVDALIYLHQALKLWLAPHVLVTSLMLALLLVHIIQVIYFLAK